MYVKYIARFKNLTLIIIPHTVVLPQKSKLCLLYFQPLFILSFGKYLACFYYEQVEGSGGKVRKGSELNISVMVGFIEKVIFNQGLEAEELTMDISRKSMF
jgi:hypothetical protein